MVPFFVILQHDSPRGRHFDFMLDVGDSLKTWALPQTPQPGAEMQCESLADHRPAYLDFEGPVSGGRGSVVRWDKGEYVLLRQTDEAWVVDLVGKKIKGRATLHRVPGSENRWILRFG